MNVRICIKDIMSSGKSFTIQGFNRVFRVIGMEVNSEPSGFPGIEPWVAQIIERVRSFIMTSGERISALGHAVRYVAKYKIPGDIVECGVWRGGSMMAAALTLEAEEDLCRTLHLFDAFAGMPPPSEVDRAIQSGRSAAFLLEEADSSSDLWALAPIDAVRVNLESTNYPADRIRLIRGRVEDTVPGRLPRRSLSLGSTPTGTNR